MRPLHLFVPACLPALVLCLLLASAAHAETPPPSERSSAGAWAAPLRATTAITPGVTQGPDFSNTPDILNGQNYLVRNDDIVMAQSRLPDQPNPTTQSNLYFYSMLTANGAISSVQAVTTTFTMSYPVFYNPAAAVGRMFDLPHDVVAVLAMNEAAPPDAQPLNLVIHDLEAGVAITQQIALFNAAFGDLAVNLLPMAMGDFNGDGYDELAFSYSTNITDAATTIQIMQATNPLSFTAGVRVGPAFVVNTTELALTAAKLGGQPAANLLLTTDSALHVLTVDPNTLALTQKASVEIPDNYNTFPALAAGDFDDDPADDEAVVFKLADSDRKLHLLLYDFPAPQLTPTLLDDQASDFQALASYGAAAGKVHWLDPSDAIIFGALNVDNQGVAIDKTLLVYTVENGQLVQQALLAQNNYVYAVALGRFDNPIAAGAGGPDLQLAVLTTDITGDSAPTTAWLNTYNIGSAGAGYTPTLSSPQTLTFANPAGSLAVGDLQGRGLRLGSPTKITIDGHSAPRTMVGVPPMHLDWVVPSCSDPDYPDNCSTPQVVNILAYPSSNWAQFNTEIKNNIQSSSKTSTAWSAVVKLDAEAKLGYTIPDVESIDVDVKDEAQKTYATAVDTESNSYAEFTFDTSVRTGFADHIWFDGSRFNIWNYRVIGKTACPAATPNCAADQRLPLHVQFSGPDQVSHYNLDGGIVEWYQPQWEPGNLLSYPWTEAQLLATLPRPVINNKSDVWAADSSGSNASVTWAGGVGQQFSSGTTHAFSNDTSVTVNGSTSIFGYDASGSVGFDSSTISSTETLGTNSSQNGSSTGFNVSKSAQGVDDYVYAAQTYILSQNLIPGTLFSLPVSATVPMSGSLRLAYWANPFDSVTGGPWWARTYVLPDVALNHPQRWTWSTSPTKGDILTFNQVITTISPFDQEFYYMRGLFVTDANAPGGPQITTSTVTQTLLLQSRVYNYSHVDMDAPALAQKAARVHVRFYGQVFQSDEGDYPVGDSFLIGETTLSPIPGFASTTTPGNPPNWRMATLTFNPANFAQTANGNIFLRFWVAVWMEDSSGAMVKEMAGHGLTASPGSATINTMGDVAIEPYSNNVGSLKQVYYLQDALASQPVAAVTPLLGSELPTLTVDAALVSPPPQLPTMPGPLGKHLVTSTIAGGAEAITALQLVYFDGDPAQGGKAFDWEYIPYIAANTTYINRVTYTPQQCGQRTVYVVARAGNAEYAGSTPVANVACVAILPYIGK